MFKMAGAILVILACSMIGVIVAQNYTRRPRHLKALMVSLQMLEMHILYAASPLPEALSTISQSCDSGIAPIFKRTMELLLTKEGYSASEAWDKALKEQFEHTALNKTDLQILKSFGGTLGISDRTDQEKHIRLAAEQIKMEIIKAEENAVKQTRLWRYMGFLGGLMIVLIIY